MIVMFAELIPREEKIAIIKTKKWKCNFMFTDFFIVLEEDHSENMEECELYVCRSDLSVTTLLFLRCVSLQLCK